MTPRLGSIKTKMRGKHLRNMKSKITTMQLLRTSLCYQTREFFNNSTLHGVRYIAESDRPFGERFMWFCFTMIGFISALVIIFSLWEKYQTNPTITGMWKNSKQIRTGGRTETFVFVIEQFLSAFCKFKYPLIVNHIQFLSA